jgi:DNA-binding Lrp family transcriptional regulator
LTSRHTLKILGAVMSNSKKTDRQIASQLNVSQPTVSRQRAMLKKEGYIKDYVVVPDLSKLGYDILAISKMPVGSSPDPLLSIIRRDDRVIGALRNSSGITVVSKHRGVVDLEEFQEDYDVSDSEVFSVELGLVKDFAIKTI